MKPAKLYLLISALMALPAMGQPIQSLPQTNAPHASDLLVFDALSGGAYHTMIITVSNFANSPFFATNSNNIVYSNFNSTQFTTNGGVISIPSGVPFTNANLVATTTISNARVNGSFVYSNSTAVAPSFSAMIGGTNPPFSQIPLIGQSIAGGNTSFLDTLNIWAPYDQTNNFADISFGNGQSSLGPSDFHQVGVIGISSQGGNWNLPYTNQSNFGVWDGFWSSRNSFNVEVTHSTPVIINGQPSIGRIVPELILLSRDYNHMLIPDQWTGETNYFDFNKTNANFYVPYGSIVPSQLCIGSDTNVPSFTAVFTNWIGGAPYTNQTGRNIFVLALASISSGSNGVGLLELTEGGFRVQASSVSTVTTNNATVAITNTLCYLITNSGVFAWTNLSTGTGQAIVGGGYYEVH